MSVTIQRIYQTIGDRIRERRKHLGLNQDELAEMVGLARTSVTNVEIGRQRLLVHQLFDFAIALQTDVAALLGLAPPTPRDWMTIDPPAIRSRKS